MKLFKNIKHLGKGFYVTGIIIIPITFITCILSLLSWFIKLPIELFYFIPIVTAVSIITLFYFTLVIVKSAQLAEKAKQQPPKDNKP